MVTIVNYGLGNIQAFNNIYSRLNFPSEIAATPQALSQAKKLILPGVGSFDWAMSRLNDSGLRDILNEQVLINHVPILGVCVGMQMMAYTSEEGKLPGLGWINATVKRFDEASFIQKTHLPHMGWNDVVPVQDHPLFNNIKDPKYYFLHSYYFIPGQASQTLATSNYGINFASAVVAGHIIGVQFHPEKSHDWGVQLLKNFALL